MRIGIMIGPETRNYAGKVDRLVRRRRRGRRGGLRDGVDPAAPAGLRRDDRGRAHGAGDEPHRARHRGGAAAVAPSGRARAAGAVGAGGVRRSVQPRASGRRTTGSSTTCSGLPYEQPAQVVEDYLDVFDAMFAGPSPVDVENDRFRIHNPLDITDLAPTPVLLAALGPVMLRIAGERTDGTVLWMADERAIAEHVVPADHEGGRGRGPAGAARRRRRPGRLCARRRGGRGARARQPHPRPRRVLAQLPAAARAG